MTKDQKNEKTDDDPKRSPNQPDKAPVREPEKKLKIKEPGKPKPKKK